MNLTFLIPDKSKLIMKRFNFVKSLKFPTELDSCYFLEFLFQNLNIESTITITDHSFKMNYPTAINDYESPMTNHRLKY